jgi:hypothetical protein
MGRAIVVRTDYTSGDVRRVALAGVRFDCKFACNSGSDSNLMMACQNRGVRRKRISLK